MDADFFPFNALEFFMNYTVLAYSPWFFGVQVVKRQTISDIGIDDLVHISGRKWPFNSVGDMLGDPVVDSDLYGTQLATKGIFPWSISIALSWLLL
jgi:hypothetical protein